MPWEPVIIGAIVLAAAVAVIWAVAKRLGGKGACEGCGRIRGQCGQTPGAEGSTCPPGASASADQPPAPSQSELASPRRDDPAARRDTSQ